MTHGRLGDKSATPTRAKGYGGTLTIVRRCANSVNEKAANDVSYSRNLHTKAYFGVDNKSNGKKSSMP